MAKASNIDEHKSNISTAHPLEEEMIEAVQIRIGMLLTVIAAGDDGGHDTADYARELSAMEAVLQRLEASRWRPAVADVVAERQRQIGGEGWDYDHDDRHTSGELLFAAAAYCENVGQAQLLGFGDDTAQVQHVPQYWPWSLQWWKPKNRRRDLVRAAALLVAEIERLDRASPPSTASEGE